MQLTVVVSFLSAVLNYLSQRSMSMRNKLISLKKALFGGMAFVMAATLVAPASPVLAAEIETQTEASESGAQAQTDIGKSTADTAASSQAAGAQARRPSKSPTAQPAGLMP